LDKEWIPGGHTPALEKAARLTMTDAMIFIEVELWRDHVTHNCPKIHDAAFERSQNEKRRINVVRR
jgi:hypothetical protein